MSDIQMINDMILGLQQKKKNLQADEAIFLKLSGINEEIEKASQDKDAYETELSEAKTRRDAAKKLKAASVSKTISMIAEKMNQVIPFGTVIFTFDEDDDGKRTMNIGWKNGDIVTPYNGMSGMQKQVFESAIAYVLGADIIVVEAAELDKNNLKKTLEALSKIDKQVIVNTWVPIDFEIPKNFTVVEV